MLLNKWNFAFWIKAKNVCQILSSYIYPHHVFSCSVFDQQMYLAYLTLCQRMENHDLLLQQTVWSETVCDQSNESVSQILATNLHVLVYLALEIWNTTALKWLAHLSKGCTYNSGLAILYKLLFPCDIDHSHISFVLISPIKKDKAYFKLK